MFKYEVVAECWRVRAAAAAQLESVSLHLSQKMISYFNTFGQSTELKLR